MMASARWASRYLRISLCESTCHREILVEIMLLVVQSGSGHGCPLGLKVLSNRISF